MIAIEETINNLIDIIEKEIKYNFQLLELLIQEQKILISSDVTAVEKNVEEQDYLIGNIKRLEEIRIENVNKISEIYGKSDKDLKFSEIIELVNEEYADKLSVIMEKLKSVVENITKININNKYLIESGLEFLEENVKVFYGANEKELFYKKGGKKKKEKGSIKRIVDRKV